MAPGYPRPAHQTKGRFLTGDILRMKDGSVGVVSEVSINNAQEDPYFCQYSLNQVKGFDLSYNAWWSDDAVTDFILGPLHALEEWRSKYQSKKVIPNQTR